MTQNKIYRSILVILAFTIYKFQNYIFAYTIFGVEEWNKLNKSFAMTLIVFVGIFLALLCNYLINKGVSFRELGLKKDVLHGLKWGFIFTLPMFIGLPILVNFEINFAPQIAYQALFLAGFGEEFVFRGFLFGLLFYFAGWGFLSAGIFTGLFFGLGHLYQADSFTQAIGIFLFTTGASLGFAWFYYAWKSLWMVIFLHGFMDLAWDMTMTGEHVSNVLGSPWVNVFRFTTLIFAIVFSIYHSKKIGSYDLKHKLWINKS